MSRDFLFSATMVAVKENGDYEAQFLANIFSGKAAGALKRMLSGKMDLSRQEDRWLQEYIMSGAKTGFSHLTELKNIQKDFERELKQGKGKNAGRMLLDGIANLNEFAENLCRFSLYMTSRERGRTIQRSVSDAKEITVNFNRNGAGGDGAGVFKPLFLFSNAAVQALQNSIEQAGKHKGKMAIALFSYAASGIIMPLLSQIGGDGDEYWKLSEWDRQNNLCIDTPWGYIKVPLPQELRVFHAMGDNVMQAILGMKDWDKVLEDTLIGLSDLLPINPVGDVKRGGLAQIAPDAGRPIAEIWGNKTFSGRPITDEYADLAKGKNNRPGYTKVYTNKRGESYVPTWLVDTYEWLNSITGGDQYKKGLATKALDILPSLAVDIDLGNPDVLYHILNGYLGGLYDIAMKVADVPIKANEWYKTGENPFTSKNIPVANRFFVSNADTYVSKAGLSERYYKERTKVEEDVATIKDVFKEVKEGAKTEEQFRNYIDQLPLVKSGLVEVEIERYKNNDKDGKYKKGDLKSVNVYDVPTQEKPVKLESEGLQSFSRRTNNYNAYIKELKAHNNTDGIIGLMKTINKMNSGLSNIKDRKQQKVVEGQVAGWQEDFINIYRNGIKNK